MAEKKSADKNKYIEKIGRRKESVARVRITPASKMTYAINDKTVEDYFPVALLQEKIYKVFKLAEIGDKFAVTAKVRGGGINGQAEAIALGLSRALVSANPEAKSPLKKNRQLTRDARVVERKKFGKKKARKSPQWSKR